MRQDTKPSILVDGAVAAGWEIADRKAGSTLTVLPYRPLGRRERAGIEAEGAAFLGFMRPEAPRREVTFGEASDG